MEKTIINKTNNYQKSDLQEEPSPDGNDLDDYSDVFDMDDSAEDEDSTEEYIISLKTF